MSCDIFAFGLPLTSGGSKIGQMLKKAITDPALFSQLNSEILKEIMNEILISPPTQPSHLFYQKKKREKS